MNDFLSSIPFEMAGSFGGFVFTEMGKRRMLLRQSEEDCLLKVPRPLRRRIIGKFRSGEPIRVAGFAEQDPATGILKRVVTQVLLEADGPSASAPPLPLASIGAVHSIRLCSKKNCWRKGGQELWEALRQELAARGLDDQIELRQVGCLDRCKRAPNLDCGKCEYAHCSPHDASAIIERALGTRLLYTSDKLSQKA